MAEDKHNANSVILRHDRPERTWRLLTWSIVAAVLCFVAAAICALFVQGNVIANIFSGRAIDVVVFGLIGCLVLLFIIILARRR